MLEKLLEMSRFGIFDSLNRFDIKNIIENCTSDEDIKLHLDEIQSCIKMLSIKNSKYSTLRSKISDFCDKFQVEMFYMSKRCDFSNEKTKVFQKELSYGTNAGSISFGIDKNTSYFNINERKLLKLINNYYISAKQTNINEFFVPLSSLKYMFSSEVNNFVMKEKIIETVSNLNKKRVYWSFSNCKLDKSKGINDIGLTNGKNEPLVNLQVIFLPRFHEKGVNKITNSVLGIYCKETNFMKMRYQIKQIYNGYPLSELRLNSIEYDISEYILYRVSMMNYGKNKSESILKSKRLPAKAKKTISNNIHNSFTKDMSELLNVTYYDTGSSYQKTYYEKLFTEPNQIRTIKHILKSLTNVSVMLNNECSLKTNLILKRKPLLLVDKNGNAISTEELYNKLSSLIPSSSLCNFIRDGELQYRIAMQ